MYSKQTHKEFIHWHMHIDMVLINGRVNSVEPLPMTLIIFLLLMIQLISPNLIKHRMNGYRRIKVIGVIMISGGSVFRINTVYGYSDQERIALNRLAETCL